ncbi:BRO family protein [Desulfobotulus sp. H1]|uniref:BRO family protein n=1 Tax=Desulfobotulus pelophilus TaxID=2823377 RepID=A0ABT3ND69_9BACT|nr:BRO family protein [Desulfobotulus pelophilus]MCW7755410.1 BRO family protein [Desulfobotulus pelophilus]
MDTAVQVFENREFGQVRIVEGRNGEPWFVATDIARALGYEKPNNAINSHCKKVNKINYPETGHPINIIPEADLYRLIMRSNLESAEKFQDWVVEEVLPSIRRTGAYQIPRNDHPLKILIQQDFWAAECVADMLRVSDDSRLTLCYAIYDRHGLDKSVLPQYTEAPRQRMSASALLKKHNVDMSTIKFNQLMVNNGMLEERERTGASGAVRKFKNLTDLGLAFGENMVSPQNPRETHPMYYEDAFEDLLMTLTMGTSQEP